MKHTIGVAVLILTAALFFSCTDGDYKGSGGEGNFNLVDRSNTLNSEGKYIFVSGEIDSKKIGLIPRQKVKKGKVSAPLYYVETGIKYTGNDKNVKLTITVHNDETTTDETKKKEFDSVQFWRGSALVEW